MTKENIFCFTVFLLKEREGEKSENHGYYRDSFPRTRKKICRDFQSKSVFIEYLLFCWWIFQWLVSHHGITTVNALDMTMDALVAKVWSNHSTVFTKSHFRSPLDPRYSKCIFSGLAASASSAGTRLVEKSSRGAASLGQTFLGRGPWVRVLLRPLRDSPVHQFGKYWSRAERPRYSPYASASLWTVAACAWASAFVAGGPQFLCLIARLTEKNSYMHSPNTDKKPDIENSSWILSGMDEIVVLFV